jgi:hypothetical protein
MKHIIEVKSNAFYTQTHGTEFKLNPFLELVIIYLDGKDYKTTKTGYETLNKVTEVRMIVNPSILTALITDLQLHQKTLEGITKNADQLSALVKHISTSDNP